MNGAVKQPPRWVALAVLLGIAGLLAAWELYGERLAVDRGVREVVVVMTADGPFPDVLFMEQGASYRIAVTSIAGEHTLTGVTLAAEESSDGGRSVAVRPGEIVWLQVEPSAVQDGRRLGGVGPVMRTVESLALLAAQGDVYSLALLATEDGLLPQQVRVASGARIQVGGVSTGEPRTLHIDGTGVRMALWPGELLERAFDTPVTAGTYNVVCEQGCEEGWKGQFRIETAETTVPWVEARDTAAAAEVSKVAPDFALYDLNGRVVQLSDFRGEKGVFINFWATWCEPCVREMPLMQQLYAERGHEFELLAVNFMEHRPQVRAWVDSYGLEFPILMDVSGAVAARYGVWSYPTSIFVDKDGVVRGRFTGELSYRIMEDFVNRISEYRPAEG